ncbi:uncharacterized protein LOC109790784 [Cajanus cajan]|uniref:PB1 domain-containing protein n=1 Tax=Cajanus cajan TaxID=3821 RepID=A0A151R1N0_CAJCA|nr:uncharacterized protein LOC109790784 [Cajanus cajan]KYP36419.1 hypothetical protein KK1_042466 [Cajanus cajan]
MPSSAPISYGTTKQTLSSAPPTTPPFPSPSPNANSKTFSNPMSPSSKIDGELRYVGNHTKVLTVHRSVTFSELIMKLGKFCGSCVILRCQLPEGDLETLISITNDEDLAIVIEEYDHALSKLAHPLKIRPVLSPPKSMKKGSLALSSASSSASHSSARSPHTSSESLPYAVAYRIGRHNRSPPENKLL